MNLARSDEQRMLQDSALAFLSGEYGFAQRALSVQHPQRCRDATWRHFAEMGWLALPLPEACGGLGGSASDLGLLMQEMGRHGVVEPFHACTVIAARLLCEAAGGSHADLLAGIAAGTRRAAFAHREAGCIDAFSSGATRSRQSGSGLTVSGRKLLVAGAPGASHLVLSARDEAGAPVLLLVDAAAAGVDMRPVPTADDGMAADVGLADAPAILLARGDAAVHAVQLTLAGAQVALAWDACGAMDAALRGSVDYTSQRVQFGQPIGHFQVIQHRLAEMAVAVQEARAACELASTRLDAAPGDLAVAQAMAALVGSKVGRCARFVAQEAVQVHGAMGVCEELPIAASFRRLTAFGALSGTAMRHSAAYGRQALAASTWQHSVTLGPARADGQGELQAFRAEVRAFIGEQLTDAMRAGQSHTSGVYPEPPIAIAWQRALAQRGWLVPLWPREWGGTGWSSLQRIAFENECMLAGAPLVHPMGVRLVGPVILRFGTEAQKQHFLPRILSSQDYWCQGFSEPGAGSDLASLKLQAVPDGDDYVLDGSKIWTTHAQHANWMFALVRTSNEGKRQDGISFLLVDMASPGITVRPIATIGGDHDVNQVFFENVRVPQANRIGAENAGWECAKYLLEFERGAGIFGPRLRSQLKRVGLALAAAGPRPDETLAIRFGEVLADLDTFEQLELRALAPLAPGQNPGPVSSILKLRASRLKQSIAELGVECLGPEAMRWHDPDGMEDGALAALVPDYANSRAATIFGGAAEVQLGIIARTALAL